MRTIQCPICSEEDNFILLDLGRQPLANQLFTTEVEARRAKRYDLSLRCCNNCLYVWLNTLVSPEELFSNNTYLTSVSKETREDMHSFANDCIKSCKLSSGDSVIDIASNDGTLLSFFKEVGLNIIGVEPSKSAFEIAISKDIPTLNKFFDEGLSQDILRYYGKFDLITATNLITHIEDPKGFLENCKVILKPNGTIALEFYYFESLISNVAFDQIYHEHVSYFDFQVFNNLVKRVGLEIYDAKLVRSQGGSLRVFVGFPDRHKVTNRVTILLQTEGEPKMIKERYIEFARMAINKAAEIKNYLFSLADNNLKIYGYGASAKATVVTNFTGIDNHIILAIADRSPLKQGKFIPGNCIPIITPDKLSSFNPDVIVIFSWNLKDEIINYLNDIVAESAEVVIFTPALEKNTLHKYEGKL
jgi:SAM-dependent methyltransferase